jgi:hypothetical protein
MRVKIEGIWVFLAIFWLGWIGSLWFLTIFGFGQVNKD